MRKWWWIEIKIFVSDIVLSDWKYVDVLRETIDQTTKYCMGFSAVSTRDLVPS